MIRPQISKAACQDLDAIAEYFLTRNIDAGERFFQEFNQKCKYLLVLVSPESTPKIVTFTARNKLKSDWVKNGKPF